jgi:SAM-dependent methyltransferase
MARDRDVQAFHDRAPSYEIGWSGRVHGDITARTVDLALEFQEHPAECWKWDAELVCCSEFLAQRLPRAEELAGIDAAQGMIDAAQASAGDPRLQFTTGIADKLRYSDASFDLVVSTTSFDQWKDQRSGLLECARVLTPEGHLVVTDLFSVWLYPNDAARPSGSCSDETQEGRQWSRRASRP